LETISGRIKEIACGNKYSMALLEDGTIRVWGKTYEFKEKPNFENLNMLFPDLIKS
jgi:alpha-tubulin suppressor-like RCC1 family protein